MFRDLPFKGFMNVCILWTNQQAPFPQSLACPWTGKKWYLNLVGGSTHLKNMLVKLDHFPRDRGENRTCLKPPPRYLFVGAKKK